MLVYRGRNNFFSSADVTPFGEDSDVGHIFSLTTFANRLPRSFRPASVAPALMTMRPAIRCSFVYVSVELTVSPIVFHQSVFTCDVPLSSSGSRWLRFPAPTDKSRISPGSPHDPSRASASVRDRYLCTNLIHGARSSIFCVYAGTGLGRRRYASASRASLSTRSRSPR